MRDKCKTCGKTVTFNEIGLSKKLIGRNATEFECIECLSKRFNCTVSLLNDKIEYFKSQGCTLFV
ncbi:MAG: hypothetical protein IKC83_01830 [Clostridia bacterium]|nr:hypothetical protein [Clostridia bacterium]